MDFNTHSSNERDQSEDQHFLIGKPKSTSYTFRKCAGSVATIHNFVPIANGQEIIVVLIIQAILIFQVKILQGL
jgi:hypothetical protein